MSRAVRFAPLILLLSADRRRWSGGWRRRPTRRSTRQLEGKPVPAFDLAAGAADGKPGLTSRRPRDGQAAICSTSSPAGACRASPKRRCSASCKARGVDDRRHRGPRPPEDARRIPRPQRRSLRADRQRPAEPGADRARLVGRAGELRRRWQGHHPLPAYRPDRAARRADDPRASWSRRDEAALLLHCACSPRSRCSPTATCRRLIGPTASCPTRGRKRRRRR